MTFTNLWCVYMHGEARVHAGSISTLGSSPLYLYLRLAGQQTPGTLCILSGAGIIAMPNF